MSPVVAIRSIPLKPGEITEINVKVGDIEMFFCGLDLYYFMTS